MKPISIVSMTALIAFSACASAQGEQDGRGNDKKFKFTLGTGLVSSPYFLGDDDYQTSVLPNISVRYGDRLKASLRGVEYTAIKAKQWSAGPTLAYDFGRNEQPDDNPFLIAGDASTDLVGLGDIDGTVELGGFVEYKTRSVIAKLALAQGVDGGHDGLVADASISYRGKLSSFGRPAFYSIGPSISFGDDTYNSTLFDVSAAQSEASGISQYDASGGLNSLGLDATLIMPVTKKISLVGFAQYDQLTGDVADASLVTERGSKNQYMAGFFINYGF